MVVKADLGVVSHIRQMVAQAIQHFGLDILLNNAGLVKNADFWNVTEDYDSVINVNFKGVFFATQAIAQHLRETNRPGKIINISSVHEELPFPHFTSYCASKGGVKMMMRNLAVELRSLSITINYIAPGAIETPINKSLINDPDKLNAVLNNIPLGRLGQPNDVAALVAFLASSEAYYITGSTFFVDWFGIIKNSRELTILDLKTVRKL